MSPPPGGGPGSVRLPRRGAELTRRRFLRLGGGATLAATTLAGTACSGADSAERELDLYTWEGYDLTDVLASWRASRGLEVRTTYIGVQDDVATRLVSPSSAGIDSSTANQSFIDYFDSLGIMSPITVEEVPELAGLFPIFQGKPWRNDDGTYNSVPWTWGPLGLTYVPERLAAPTSWDVFLEPELKGRITLLDDAQQVTQLAAVIRGHDPDQLTRAQLADVKSYLLQVVGQCRTITATTGDQVSLMESGEIDLVFLGWTGIDAAARKKGFTATTMIPPGSRSIAFSDAAFVPPRADNRTASLALCRELVSGEVAAQAAEIFLAATTAPAVVPLISDAARKPFPYADIQSYFEQVRFPRGFPREAGDFVTLDDVLTMWNEVKSAQ